MVEVEPVLPQGSAYRTVTSQRYSPYPPASRHSAFSLPSPFSSNHPSPTASSSTQLMRTTPSPSSVFESSPAPFGSGVDDLANLEASQTFDLDSFLLDLSRTFGPCDFPSRVLSPGIRSPSEVPSRPSSNPRFQWNKVGLSPEALERLAGDYVYFTSRFILARPDEGPAGQKLSSYVSAMLRASPVACAALAAVGVLWKWSSHRINRQQTVSASRSVSAIEAPGGEEEEEKPADEGDDTVGPDTAEKLYEEAAQRLGDVLTEGKTPLTAKLASILDIG
jgi:hypothetical protein